MTTNVRQLLDKKGNEVYSISADITVFEAITLMSVHEVGALVVMENDKLVGIISERDYTRKVILKDRSSKSTSVREIMTSKIICVTPENSIEECMLLMAKHHIRHLPVIENDKVTGILTVMDAVKTTISEKEFIIDQLEHYIAGSG
ncbi:MAG: CBS domain-containing protein [Gammaproteobacteria bacterium]|nr:CBS domain-containing protein [Gammaproteobacteria bacterium]